MSSGKFRQRLMTHQKDPTDIWNNFIFQMGTYFHEWVRRMNVTTFTELPEFSN